MDSGKVVLVTAAAGGTGQFAVQVHINLLQFASFKCVCEHLYLFIFSLFIESENARQLCDEISGCFCNF